MDSLPEDEERRERKRKYEREYYANSERRRAKLRSYRDNDLDFNDKVRRRLAKRKEDPEYVKASKEYMASYYQKNREQKLAKDSTPEARAHRKEVRKVWAEKNKETIRENNRKRRAIEQNAYTEKYSTKDVIERYGTVCHICEDEIDISAPRKTGVPGWELGLHIDHLVLLSRGGDDTLSNVRPAHGLCNLKRPKS